ncbi:MAG: FtsX-like permease family protein [Bacteroidia bacterium]|nr:FtsX-like permease family protein [Bacteroidia bacterium]
MNLPFYIARRYLFSRKSSNAINIITWVSIAGIGVGTAALILVLSVFNGLTTFIEGLFAAMDPDIKIVAARGQVFEHSDDLYRQLSEHPEVVALTRTIEGRVWLEYVDNQTYGTIKGVEADFLTVNRVDTFVYAGEYDFKPRSGVTQAVLGSVIAANLNADLENDFRPVSVSYIPHDASISNPINTEFLFPSGYFSVQKEYDEKYVLTDFYFVRDLFELKNEITAYELRLTHTDRAGPVKKEIEAIVGPDFEVLTWYEQHQTLYKVMRNEKYVSYLILVLMLAIAAVNIVGSLSMIVLEKTRDIAVLKSMGATRGMIRKIFLADGLLVGGVGGIFGVIVALITGLAQKYLGFIQLNGGESFRVKAFPIELQLSDFILVAITVITLSVLASVYPAFQASRVKVIRGLRM